MSAVATIDIRGIAEIRERLTPEALLKVLVPGLRAALQPVAVATSALAPHRTGKLAGSIRVRVGSRGGSIRGAILAGTTYGHLVEYGHRMVTGGRVARPGRFTSLTARARLKGTVVGQVPPHPFARPAFAAQQEQVAQTIEQRLVAAIEAP